MQTRAHERTLTLLDVVAAVSGLTKNDDEAAEVINHLFGSEQIAFANRPPRRDLEVLLS